MDGFLMIHFLTGDVNLSLTSVRAFTTRVSRKTNLQKLFV